MRIFYAKKELKCYHCKEPIERGTPFIRISYRGKNRWWRSVTYHKACYLEQLSEYIDRWVEEHPQGHKGHKQGRPPEYRNPARRNSLLTAARYHERRGHIKRALELREEAETFRINTCEADSEEVPNLSAPSQGDSHCSSTMVLPPPANSRLT